MIMFEAIQDIDSAEKFLQHFSQFRPTERKPTWMEICSYPHHRFEEICSRILQFYLNPDNPHGLKNLFVKSLMETLIDKTKSEMARYIKEHKNEKEFVITRGPNATLRLFAIEEYENFIKRLEITRDRVQLDLIKRGLEPSNVELELSKEESDLLVMPRSLCVEREVGTENDKRIDLLMYSDTWVVCIENKIFADKYNPFNEYQDYVSKRFEHISEGNRFFIVLSLKKQDESDGIWTNIYYRDFFECVRNNIGDYLQNANGNYLTFLMDWMKTLEYKENDKESLPMGNFTEEEIKFFSDDDNATKIDKLIARKQEFDANHRNAFVGMRESIKKTLIESFKDQIKPWDWQDVLAIDFNYKPGTPFIDVYAKNGKCQIEFATREWLDKKDLCEFLMNGYAQKLNKLRNTRERIVLEKCELQEDVIVNHVCYWIQKVFEVV